MDDITDKVIGKGLVSLGEMSMLPRHQEEAIYPCNIQSAKFNLTLSPTRGVCLFIPGDISDMTWQRLTDSFGLVPVCH